MHISAQTYAKNSKNLSTGLPTPMKRIHQFPAWFCRGFLWESRESS